MMVLITYDVSLEDSLGAKRLRQVAKTCENYGQRVQKSVFECLVQPDEYVVLKNKLLSIIDKKKDSIRIYKLGSNWKRKIEQHGALLSYEQDEPIIL